MFLGSATHFQLHWLKSTLKIKFKIKGSSVCLKLRAHPLMPFQPQDLKERAVSQSDLPRRIQLFATNLAHSGVIVWMVTDLYRTVKSVAQPINGDSLTFDPQHNQFFFCFSPQTENFVHASHYKECMFNTLASLFRTSSSHTFDVTNRSTVQ